MSYASYFERQIEAEMGLAKIPEELLKDTEFIGLSNLSGEILARAVEDYRKALTSNNTRVISDCESFFRGRCFSLYACMAVGYEVSGPEVMRIIQKQVEKARENSNPYNERKRS